MSDYKDKRAAPGVVAELYARHIGPMRERAREFGYALAVHGSLARDIDIVAVPWSEGAASAEELVRALHDLTGAGWTQSADSNEIIARAHPDGMPAAGGTRRPHGRRVWSLYLTLEGPTPEVYIDLSVMPRSNGAEA